LSIDRYLQISVNLYSLLYLGAIFDVWESNDGSFLPSIGIITTQANDFIHAIHHRMPLMLSPGSIDPWMDPSNQNLDKLRTLLHENTAPPLRLHRVSPAVNKVANDYEALTHKYSPQVEIQF